MRDLKELCEGLLGGMDKTMQVGDDIDAAYKRAELSIKCIYDALVNYKNCETSKHRRWDAKERFATNNTYEWDITIRKTNSDQLELAQFLGGDFTDAGSIRVQIIAQRHTPEKVWHTAEIHVLGGSSSRYKYICNAFVIIDILTDEFNRYNTIRDVAKHIIAKHFKDLDTFIKLVKDNS